MAKDWRSWIFIPNAPAHGNVISVIEYTFTAMVSDTHVAIVALGTSGHYRGMKG